MLWEAYMGLLDLIKEDQSSEYISLKEAIDLIAVVTKSNIYEVATYLLNKNVESTLYSYARDINYKLKISRPPNDLHWIGENYAFQALTDIAEDNKDFSPSSISAWSRYAKTCEETFWNRKDFFNLECIKILNLPDSNALKLNKQQLHIWDKNNIDFQYNDVGYEENTDNNNFQSESINLEVEMPPVLKVDQSNQYKNGGHIILDDEDKELASQDNYRSKFKFIRWSYWFEKPMIACHDAVLLSLGLDPENIDYTNRKWATDLKSNDRIELDERILNFKQLIGPEKLFVSDVDGDLKTLVSLKKVAKYLYKRKCDMPQQLLEFINKSVETDNHQTTTPYTVELYDSLLHENEQLKEKIKKLESLSLPIPAEVEIDNLLGLIFDKTASHRYAPDLVYAIQLWKSIYLDNPKTDSHNNKANTWIKNNTPYSGEQEDTATRRLREIATPFQDFHPSRKKSLENK